MPFSDDEQDVPSADSSGGRKPLGNGEKLVRLVAYSNKKAPLKVNRQQVMLELTDASSTGYRSGLDLVAVLDVSGSMAGKKLHDTKVAMQFIIKKLSPIDRLSIVSFSTTAKRVCRLHFMTEDRQVELERLVNELEDDSLTNISDGLLTGRQVLDGRRLSGGRVASIILMSDGEHNVGSVLPENVDVGNVAVYTFGFGDDHKPRVLDMVAKNSRGGTYNYVKDGVALSGPFSQILGGLLSVVVRDLKLTVWPDDSKIEKVDPGSYPQTQDAAAGSVTVSFGDLYSREVRKVMVDLLLPAVEREYVATVIIAQCSYSVQEKPFLAPPLRCSIRRTRTAAGPDAIQQPTEVKTELARRDHADLIGEVSTMDPAGARDKLEGGRKALDNLDESNPMVGIWKTESEQLRKLTEPPELYETQGRPYARSTKTSHDLQRMASRGDVQDVRPFATPLMDKYLEQAKKFQEDPNMPLPSLDDDVRDEEEPPPMPLPLPPEDEERVTETLVPDQPRVPTTWWGEYSPQHRATSRRAWVMVILCTVLAILVVVTIAAVLSVYLIYKPNTPYLEVSDAQLGQLQGGQYLQVSITILANNLKSKADATFSSFELAMGFHGAEVALLRSEPFVVPRQSSLPLHFNVVALDPAGMRDMDESLDAGLVPLDLSGKTRTRWRVGIFQKRQFWTRISCRLRFFFPGNGTVMPTDRDRCRSRLT
ncbi:hypothetical protein QYE76_019239 [Lolium multiflorum]|uniref:VWFA domain-containing protein n=1 Tax=Lolium multiflorum TaxID=4521 RepID=A0AAD8R4M9_LOLMU|nr:hypothetical protein QYE76_019239 [Lolium multiflorum]